MLPRTGCAYRQKVRGDKHIRCAFDWRQDTAGLAQKFQREHLTGVPQRWYRFPDTYDPMWGPETCEERSRMADSKKFAPPNPLGGTLAPLSDECIDWRHR